MTLARHARFWLTHHHVPTYITHYSPFIYTPSTLYPVDPMITPALYTIRFTCRSVLDQVELHWRNWGCFPHLTSYPSDCHQSTLEQADSQTCSDVVHNISIVLFLLVCDKWCNPPVMACCFFPHSSKSGHHNRCKWPFFDLQNSFIVFPFLFI